MTPKETTTILDILMTNYPQSYKDYSREQAENFIQLWSTAFKDTPLELVIKSVQAIIFTDPNPFAPTIGQVNCKIRELITESGDLIATETWNKLIKKLQSKGRDGFTAEDADEISPYLLNVYPLGHLKSLAIMSYSNLEYERSKFITAFKSAKNNKELELIQQGKVMQLASPERLEALGLPKTLMIGEK